MNIAILIAVGVIVFLARRSSDVVTSAAYTDFGGAPGAPPAADASVNFMPDPHLDGSSAVAPIIYQKDDGTLFTAGPTVQTRRGRGAF